VVGISVCQLQQPCLVHAQARTEEDFLDLLSVHFQRIAPEGQGDQCKAATETGQCAGALFIEANLVLYLHLQSIKFGIAEVGLLTQKWILLFKSIVGPRLKKLDE